MANPHSLHSVLREIIVEHVFVADVLRHLWQRGIYDAEILRSEFDAGGFDLILTRGDILRHIQLKAVLDGGRRRHFGISEKLAERQAGCVLIVIVDDDLNALGYRYFGGDTPTKPLPPLDGLSRTRHTKGDATGQKSERRAHRNVSLSKFGPVMSLDETIDALLGGT